MIVNNPSTILKILNDSRFIAPDYMQPGMKNLEVLNSVIQSTPLPLEGEQLKTIRREYIKIISKRYEHIVLSLEKSNIHNFFDQNSLNTKKQYDLVENWLKPVVESVMSLMVDDKSLDSIFDELWDLPTLLDVSTSPGVRIKHAEIISSFLQKKGHKDSSTMYQKIGLFLTGSNSILSTLAHSTIAAIESSGSVGENERILDTGLKNLHRIATSEVLIDGELIKPMRQIKLRMSSLKNSPLYEELGDSVFFAPGRHICPGMRISRKLWKMCLPSINQLKSKGVKISHIKYRKYDKIFNLPVSIGVTFDDRY
tara:strand:- start:143 stop:1075 length:933 start_codon:yes stop_codon:yes gene_type:complete